MTTQKKFNINIKLLLFIFIAIAVVLTGVRAYLFCTAYESSVHHFEYGNAMPRILNYIIFVVVVAILLISAIIKKGELPEKLGKVGIPEIFFAAATAVFAILGGGYSMANTIMIKDITVIESRAYTFGKIQAFLSIAVFIYFVFTAFSKEKHVKVKSVFGLLSIVWHIVFIMAVYFDMNTPLNAPVKVMFQFGAMAAMLYMVYEIRFFIDSAKPKSYVALSLASILFLLISCVPMLVGKLAGKVNLSTLDIFLCLQQLAMAGYIVSRLFTYVKDIKTVGLLEKKAEEQTQTTEENI